MDNITHNELKNMILLFLSGKGFFAWGVNALVGRALTDDRILKANGDGESDIFAIEPGNGRFWAVEVKVGNDRLRKKQITFGAAVEKRGGIFIEARSLEDVRRKYDELNPILF